MRVLQIINALTFGGAQTVVLNLARKAREQGHEIKIVCFRDGPIGVKMRQQGFDVIQLGESYCDLPAFYQLIKLVNNFKPHIIHSHLFRATFWARMVRAATGTAKLISSVHGCESGAFHQIERLSTSLTDYFVFPSNFMHGWYERHIKEISPNRARTIYPGVAISDIKPEPSTNQIITIGTLSRLHPVKGVDKLLRACRKLLSSGYDFRLLIGGDGKERRELGRLAKDLRLSDHCCFCGEISDKKSFLEKLDIFVAPSRQEAFGINVCEAMERGLPVVCAAVGGLPELVEHEKNGLLFAPESETELAAMLARLMDHPALARQLAASAKAKVAQQFNRQQSLNAHLDLYNSLHQQKRRIHFAISSSAIGGGEQVALSLMLSLRERGWQVSATCYQNGRLDQALNKHNINHSVVSARCGGLFFMARLFCDIFRYKPQVMSSHLNRASLTSGIVGRLTGTKVLSHVHGLNQKSYYKRSDMLIAVSDAVKNHLLQQAVDPHRITTISNRICEQAAKPRQLTGNNINIIIVARLHANKGHYWALKAIASNLDTMGKISIDILGDGPEKKRLAEFCQQNSLQKVVKFHGFVDCPQKFYEKAHLIMLPSLGEGIPLCLLEGMRWGLPCIATRIGGIPEIVKSGENGILVETEAANELISAIKELSNPQTYARMSQNAINFFKNFNNYNQMIDEFEAAIAEVISDPNQS